jgi:hypothetical protein
MNYERIIRRGAQWRFFGQRLKVNGFESLCTLPMLLSDRCPIIGLIDSGNRRLWSLHRNQRQLLLSEPAVLIYAD